MSRAGNFYALFFYPTNSLWRSDGEGKVWTKALCKNPWSVANPTLSYSVLLAAGGYVFAEFAYTYQRLCRSSDGGDNFTACYPSDSFNCISLVTQPGGSTIALLGDGAYFWISSDYGATWGPHTTIPWTVTRLYWPYANRLYALGTGGIAMSTDGGLTWTLLRYKNTAGGNQISALYFPPDPANPPWASTSSGNSLLRAQMINGAWNGCFEGETWVDPLSNTVPAGTPTNFRPSAFAGNSVQWVIFHDDRMIVMGASALTPTYLYTGNVDTTTNTVSGGVASNGWVKGTKVRYRAGGGSPVGGLQDGQDYYVTNVVGTTSIQLAATLSDAMAGTPVIDFTTTGNDAQTLSVAQAGIATTPIAYATAGTPVWTYPEIDRGLDFDHGHMDPNNHAYIWAMAGSTDGNANSLGGVWRSLDGGQTWSLANTGIEKYSGATSIYGAPLIVSANTPHDSVPVKPTAPVITAVTDLDPTTFTGLTVTYTPGQAALRHDLYRDGVLAVSSYASGATYHPPDRQSHSYVVRAVNDAGYTDSNAMSGADLSVPAITSIDDLSPCAQTGIHVNYLGDPAALRHDLVRDGSVAVTGYVSGALYNPADTVSHTYIIRAVYSSSTADSNSVAFADANNTPGKPVITQIGDLDLSYLTGVEVNFTPGGGATSHDLYVDSTLKRRNISSGYVYRPGDEAQHSYVVRAYKGTCYADSDPVIGRDMGIIPPPMVDAASRVVLHYDLQARAWHEVENSSPVRGYFWDHHRRVMRVWNGSTTGVAVQRGGSQFVEIDVAQLALGNSVALKRLRHVEVDLTYDEVTLTCEFYIDGQAVPVTVPQTVLPRGYKVMAETNGPDTATFSEDGSGGAFDEPRRQVLRFPCPAGGRGKVLGAKITGTVQGFGRVDDVRLAFSEV
jgi:hypothetical protein